MDESHPNRASGAPLRVSKGGLPQGTPPVSPAGGRSPAAGEPGVVVFEVPGDLAAIEGVVDHAVEHCVPARLDRRRLLFNFRVGLTEAIANAILYGNSADPEKRVLVELRAVPGEVLVRVSDEGSGFDPEAVPDPRLPENLTLPDGRGVFLMRELMDEVRFNRSGNAVTLILRDSAGAPSADVELPEAVTATLEDFREQLGLSLAAWRVAGGRRERVLPRDEVDEADSVTDPPADGAGHDPRGVGGPHRFRIPLGVGLAVEVEVAGHAADSPLVRVLAASVERAAALARDASRNRAALDAALHANRHIRLDMARERLSREMELAHDLQMKLLPPIPQLPHVDAAARVQPAKSVGGDFYQVIQLSGGRVGVMIGDVSGHGFPAALIMALVMSAAAIYAEQGAAPAKVLEHVDRAIGEELESTEMYLSLCYCVLSPAYPDIAYTNAGHPHAFVIGADGGHCRLRATDPPMGIGAAPYGQSRVRWNPDEDLLLLFTDGLSDTLAHTRRSSGEQLVLDTVAAHRQRPSGEILRRLFELCGQATPSIPSDDRTAVVLATR